MLTRLAGTLLFIIAASGDDEPTRYPVYVTVIQNSGGRTGHKLKDIFSAFALASLYDWEVVWHPTWRATPGAESLDAIAEVLPRDGGAAADPDQLSVARGEHANHTADIFGVIGPSMRGADEVSNAGALTVLVDEPAWGGLPFEAVEAIRARVDDARRRSAVVLALARATRVHLYQLANWEAAGRARAGAYSDAIRAVRRLFRAAASPHVPAVPVAAQPYAANVSVAIHVRRGDLWNPARSGDGRAFQNGGPAAYYVEVVRRLRAALAGRGGAAFRLFTERWGSYDERAARAEFAPAFAPGAPDLELVVKYCLYEDFAAMAAADVVVLTRGKGSLSDLLAYFAQGVLLWHPDSDRRDLRFDPPLRNHVPTDDTGRFDAHDVLARIPGRRHSSIK